MKILFINNDIPFPITTGSRMRTWSFINALGTEHKLSILCFDRNKESESFNEAEKYFDNIWLVNKQKIICDSNSIKRRIKGIKQLLRSEPWEIANTFSNDFKHRLIEIVNQNKFDLILAREILMGQYLIQSRNSIHAKTVVDIDDLEFVKIHHLMKIRPDNTLYGRFRRRINNFIFQLYYKKLNSIHQIIVCSRKDHDYLKNKRLITNAWVIPNSINLSRYNSVAPFTKDAFKNKTILFCGSFNYQPNIDGIQWFCKDILPLIKQKEPNIQLYIVGFKPGKKILNLASDESIFVFPNVPVVYPYYSKSSLVVVPILAAGGTRIKILEAFACRRPVVSTTLGAEGLELENDKHCIMKDGVENFAQACIRLLNDFDAAYRLTEAGYQLVKEKYDTNSICSLIRNLFNYGEIKHVNSDMESI